MGTLRVGALKSVDRIVGRAAYRRLLAAARKRGTAGAPVLPAPPDHVERILVIRPGGIGDAVLFYPMLKALRDTWPGARLDILAERRNAGIFKANDRADAVFLYDARFGRELLGVLRSRYDVVVDTEQYHYLSAIVAHLVGAPVSCGFDTRGRGGLFTHRVHYNDESYEVFSFLKLAEAVTGREHPFDPEAPFFPIRADLLESAAARYGIERGKGTIVVQPGASMARKCWAPDRFRSLARWVVDRGWRAIVVGGPGERAAARVITEGMPENRALDLCGRIPLAESAAIVALCDLYVGSDTGVLHIAYGVGTPTVHLFGPGAIEKWAPRGSRYMAISKKLPCSPCIRYNNIPPCPYDTECMKMITVDEVITAVAAVTGL